MADRIIPKGSKLITSIKRKSVRLINQVPDASVITNLSTMAWVPRLGSITPLEWDVSLGLTDVQISSRVNFFLVLVDVDNLPLITGAADRAIWSFAQFWDVLTAVGTHQTLSREVQDFFNPASFSFTERADFTQRLGIALLLHSVNKSHDAIGVLTFQETLIQRKWGGDNSTFDRDDGDWEDFASDEDDEDND